MIETERICAATDVDAENLEGRRGRVIIITDHEFENIDLRRFINDETFNGDDVEGAVIVQGGIRYHTESGQYDMRTS